MSGGYGRAFLVGRAFDRVGVTTRGAEIGSRSLRFVPSARAGGFAEGEEIDMGVVVLALPSSVSLRAASRETRVEAS
jgi:hypothetical protein